MATRAILIACSADATGVILFSRVHVWFCGLILPIRPSARATILILRFTYQGGVYCYTKLVFPFEYDQFCGLFSIYFVFSLIINFLLSDLCGLFSDSGVKENSLIFYDSFLEGVKLIKFVPYAF